MEERPLSDHSYYQFLEEEKLMGSKCADCGALFVPPRQVCIQCFSSDLEWHALQGTGKLVAFSSIAMAPPHMEKEGYGRDRPYCTGVVELEEGPRVVARIEGVDAREPGNIKPGLKMRLAFIQRETEEPGTARLAFVPLDHTNENH